MKRSLKHTIASLPIAPFLFWCGGFNFDKRGEVAATCFFCTLLIGGLVYTFSEMEACS